MQSVHNLATLWNSVSELNSVRGSLYMRLFSFAETCPERGLPDTLGESVSISKHTVWQKAWLPTQYSTLCMILCPPPVL